ncbi:MAG: hypothetical protein ABJA33_03615 [Pedococcus sp.]
MTADPRGALADLVAAFERHLEASASKRGEDDPSVIASYDDLADAFATYDDALLQAYGEMTPLDIYDGDDDDDEDEEELDDHSDEDGDGAVYSGLDDADYDDDSDATDNPGDSNDGGSDDDDDDDDEDDDDR